MSWAIGKVGGIKIMPAQAQRFVYRMDNKVDQKVIFFKTLHTRFFMGGGTCNVLLPIGAAFIDLVPKNWVIGDQTSDCDEKNATHNKNIHSNQASEGSQPGVPGPPPLPPESSPSDSLPLEPLSATRPQGSLAWVVGVEIQWGFPAQVRILPAAPCNDLWPNVAAADKCHPGFFQWNWWSWIKQWIVYTLYVSDYLNLNIYHD